MTTRAKKTPVGKTERKKRVPIHESRNVMTVENKDPNYKYRWVNDEKAGTRIARCEAAGYEFESDPNIVVGEVMAGTPGSQGSKVSKVVGADKQGNPIRAYLMKIPREFYEEDKAAKAEEIREREKGMLANKGKSKEVLAEGDGFYGEGIQREK